eukprot:CAMPEP_0206327536 /NCGR_PEP_ID=MMETSP0106_2-20121207/22206_1 /ASSEMBLY_ACC=CAM_ASM_000206 /TAXON_ID=81532 /ORGANISM="Acanthoeca-like sp., Strain 10tr" /LENGTH=95 /DNA_ID=CAMNT_0053760171 /DNA_START=15 /DNA_END=299 /DNA_ORIENTATION=+
MTASHKRSVHRRLTVAPQRARLVVHLPAVHCFDRTAVRARVRRQPLALHANNLHGTQAGYPQHALNEIHGAWFDTLPKRTMRDHVTALMHCGCGR